MATVQPLPLLLQLLVFCIFIQSNPCNSSTPTVILPLKTSLISSGSLPKPPNKLSFHHNVSLTVTLTVGTPPQPVTMVIDTGSELSWLYCKKTPNTPSIFDPLRSSSYSPIPCSSPTCRTRTRDFSIPVSCDPKKLCHATLSYADASSVEGNLASDTFHLGNSGLPGTVFGSMDSGSSSNPEEDSKTTGLIGMNRGSLSFVTQMDFPKFSYCISGRDSSGILLFGEASFPWLQPLNYTPLVQISTPLPYFDRVAYTVQLEGIKVSGKVLAIPKSVLVPDHTGAGQTMVDSGTQFTFLLGPVYTTLRNEFMQQTKGVLRVLDDPNFVFQGAMDLCYRVESTRTSLPPLPTVSLMFRGAEMSVSGERLMYRVPGERRGSDSVYCFTFGNSDLLGIEAYVIGHHHQQNMWMEFDLVKSRVGLAEVRLLKFIRRIDLSQWGLLQRVILLLVKFFVKQKTMSFVFRGTRADIETGFPGFIPERRAMRVHAARPVNSNSLAFLVTVLLLFMILNSHQMPPNFLLWLVFGIFLMATSLRMYATCQQLQAQAQAQAHAAAASGLLGHTELRLHMPPSIALATRGRLQGLRLQLALLDREFDDLDYETLRALDSDNVPTSPSMSEEEINALPVHKYKVAAPQRVKLRISIVSQTL
ncbi:hypothetical protein F0562_026172 [Nyssa sinensis]|uniref:Peptidase A1 domain-containing protein n=1 Tax=Nyssa sinensis TaxID=561372 RepID=A0A5J5BAH9_9ASTE|nr:hypothetical protein F0562_026172 [Nyssa sinensis]